MEVQEPEKATSMSYPSSPSSPDRAELGTVSQGPKGPVFKRFVDSFRQQKGVTVTPGGVVGADGKVFEAEVSVPELSHSLKPRHLQMIAIGGSIGTSFI